MNAQTSSFNLPTSQLIEQAKNNLVNINRTNLKLSDNFIRMKNGILRVRLSHSKIFQSILFHSKIDYYVKALLAKLTGKQNTEHQHIKTLHKQYYAYDISDTDVQKLTHDIDFCQRHYRISAQEYFLFGFKDKSNQEREQYISDKYLLLKLSMTGKRRQHDIELNDKNNFYLLTRPFFKREVFPVKSSSKLYDFISFALKHKRVICKPSLEGCGHGIFIADVSTKSIAENLFNKLTSGGEWIVEELIIQSKDMAVWNESSVNTLRINTFNHDGDIVLGTSFMRTGRNGSEVDNGGAGGIFAIVDTKDGKISTHGKDELGNNFTVHPDSGITYIGWQVPRWSELEAISKVIHSVVFPDMVYLSWDFALTDNGWVLIEGNWGQFVAQQCGRGMGLRSEFDKYVI